VSSLDRYAAATAALNNAHNPSPEQYEQLDAAVQDAANAAHADGYSHQQLADVYVAAEGGDA
jgi:hypothetical protein